MNKQQCVIYKQDNGVIAVMFPSPNCLQEHTIQEIAEKDVPAGKNFKIVNIENLPLDWPQETWDVDDSLLTDGVGSESYEFKEKE